MEDFDLGVENCGVPWSDKDFDYWVGELEEEGFDTDIAEMAVSEALKSHLEEDGTIDDYGLAYSDAKWLADKMQDERDKESQN